MNYDIFSDLPRIASALMCEPWLIQPEHHRSLVEQIAAHRTSGSRAATNSRGEPEDDYTEAQKPEGYLNRITSFDKATRIGMVDINGVIGKGLSRMAMDCGGLCLSMVEEGFALLADAKPVAVQLYLQTPGGTVTGVEEMADSIEEFSAMVAPVHGYVDGMCCSAGEWLGSGAATLHAAGSAMLGSIGVYSAMIDSSEAYKKKGLEVHVIASAPDKGAGFPGTVITAEQIAAARAEVMAIAGDFFAQMQRRQPSNRAALDPAVHFSGRTFRAKSIDGTALHDGLMRTRAAHLQGLISAYAPAKRRAAR